MAALLSPSTLPEKLMECSCNGQGGLKIRVEMLIDCKTEFEITS